MTYKNERLDALIKAKADIDRCHSAMNDIDEFILSLTISAVPVSALVGAHGITVDLDPMAMGSLNATLKAYRSRLSDKARTLGAEIEEALNS